MTARQWLIRVVLLSVCPMATTQAAETPSTRSKTSATKNTPAVVVNASDVDPTEGATLPGTPVIENGPPIGSSETAVPSESAMAPAESSAVPTEPGTLLPEVPAEVIAPEEVIGQGYKTCFIEDFNFDYPAWYVRADGNYLNRTTEGQVTTATVRAPDGTIGNNRIISQDFDWAPGMRAFFGRNIWDGMTYVEVGYFGLNHWERATELRNIDGVGIISSNLDLGFGTNTNPTYQRVAYSSTLHNAELNIRTFFSPRLAFVGGLRYFHLNEDLRIAEQGLVDTTLPSGAAGTVSYFNWRNVSTDNNLLGPQGGFDWACNITDDIRLNLLSRAAICANFSQSLVRQSRDGTEVGGGAGGQVIRDGRIVEDNEVVVAGLIELHSSIDVLLTRNILFRGGWQFLWVNGIAVAPEQHADQITNPNGIQRQIENGASSIFFGPFVGLEVYWGAVND
ncbi:BBP7 family outer membrane beta-barrel protein [bacterium]|nr:BBP7 family outer membrane beta-barrel protein [bacterium]